MLTGQKNFLMKICITEGFRNYHSFKLVRRELPGSILGFVCRSSRSDFLVVFSKTRVNTGQVPLQKFLTDGTSLRLSSLMQTICFNPTDANNHNYVQKLGSSLKTVPHRLLKTPGGFWRGGYSVSSCRYSTPRTFQDATISLLLQCQAFFKSSNRNFELIQ